MSEKTGAERLKEAGIWPYAPLSGPMAQGPVFPGELDVMDYRIDIATGEWVCDPGWWKRLAKPVAVAKETGS